VGGIDCQGSTAEMFNYPVVGLVVTDTVADEVHHFPGTRHSDRTKGLKFDGTFQFDISPSTLSDRLKQCEGMQMDQRRQGQAWR
jgi:hypothetical protein